MNKIDLRRIDLNLLLLFDVLMQVGSVSKAADQLGRTQSAVSHALGRLREQLGDPLLVKVGGRMQPSPYAMELVQEVRPILRSIRAQHGEKALSTSRSRFGDGLVSNPDSKDSTRGSGCANRLGDTQVQYAARCF